MQYGICLLSVVSCRKEPSNTSEMITQLLFGEHYSVLETTESWIRIKVAFDNYDCWIKINFHFSFNYISLVSPAQFLM